MKPVDTGGPEREKLQRIAESIYIYGYPLVLMDVLKRVQTSAAGATAHKSALNQFAHGRSLPSAHEKQSPHSNADCLRSCAWLDVSREPVVLSVPPHDRYHLMSFFSGWYEIFESTGPGNTGPEGATLAFVGPSWHGRLPSGIRRIASPTEMVLIEGWFETGTENLETVHRLQDQFRLTSLSDWPNAPTHITPYRAEIDQKHTPQEQVAKLDGAAFYTRLSTLMKTNPPPARDAGTVAQFAQIGFLPSEDFTFVTLPRNAAEAMRWAVTEAQSKLAAGEASRTRSTIGNWSLHVHPGRYQKNYLDRAIDARAGIPVALAEDVLCFHTEIDYRGEPLKGTNRYVIDFPSEFMPPVNAFWSITLYDSRQHLIENDIHRNVIGSRSRLQFNPDHSVFVYIQHDWPGTTRDSNWLPAPKYEFTLALKLYWPKSDFFSGSWRPPAVMRTN